MSARNLLRHGRHGESGCKSIFIYSVSVASDKYKIFFFLQVKVLKANDRAAKTQHDTIAAGRGFLRSLRMYNDPLDKNAMRFREAGSLDEALPASLKLCMQ